MLHIKLYRARKRYRALMDAFQAEAARRIPDRALLADLDRRKDQARRMAAEIEQAMDGRPAWPA